MFTLADEVSIRASIRRCFAGAGTDDRRESEKSPHRMVRGPDDRREDARGNQVAIAIAKDSRSAEIALMVHRRFPLLQKPFAIGLGNPIFPTRALAFLLGQTCKRLEDVAGPDERAVGIRLEIGAQGIGIEHDAPDMIRLVLRFLDAIQRVENIADFQQLVISDLDQPEKPRDVSERRPDGPARETHGDDEIRRFFNEFLDPRHGALSGFGGMSANPAVLACD